MKLSSEFRKLVLLAPAGARIPESLNRDRISCDANHYEHYLRDLQKLRGGVYLEDGALDPSQLTDGRHVAESDRASWHLLVVDGAGKTCGCVRYRQYASQIEFPELMAARSSLASCAVWGRKMRAAIEDELLLSEALDLPFIEIGGWALNSAIRGTAEALRMVLATYAFSREFGGAVGLATATVRHCSASILRRIGGETLEHDGEEVPAYLDSHYKCQMELLRFYSWALNPRYDVWMEEVGEEIRNVAVVSAGVPDVVGVRQKIPALMEKIRNAVQPTRAFGYTFGPIAQPALK